MSISLCAYVSLVRDNTFSTNLIFPKIMPYINVNQVDRTLASSVKRQVETLVRSTPARNTETPDFFEYVIDVENSLFSGSFSNIYLAHHRASPEQPLVARVYEPTARIDARRSIYMKVLKHIGKLLRRKGIT